MHYWVNIKMVSLAIPKELSSHPTISKAWSGEARSHPREEEPKPSCFASSENNAWMWARHGCLDSRTWNIYRCFLNKRGKFARKAHLSSSSKSYLWSLERNHQRLVSGPWPVGGRLEEANTRCQHITTSVREGQLLEGGQMAPERPGLSSGDPGG